MKLQIRPMRPRLASWTPDSAPDDRSFIVETWIASWRNRPSIIGVGDWHGVMSLAIGRILAQPEITVSVLADADAEAGAADLIGWLAYEPHAVDRSYDERSRGFEYHRVPLAEQHRGLEPLVWYCFVKAPYRKRGMARRLFERAGIDTSRRFHHVAETPAVNEMRVAGKIRQAAYRPQLGRAPHERGPHGHRPEADHAA